MSSGSYNLYNLLLTRTSHSVNTGNKGSNQTTDSQTTDVKTIFLGLFGVIIVVLGIGFKPSTLKQSECRK